MRTLFALVVLLVVVFFAGLYYAYGQVDPCRALAVEQARHSLAPTGMAEPLTRISTSQMSTAACTKEILGTWIDRVREKVK